MVHLPRYAAGLPEHAHVAAQYSRHRVGFTVAARRRRLPAFNCARAAGCLQDDLLPLERADATPNHRRLAPATAQSSSRMTPEIAASEAAFATRSRWTRGCLRLLRATYHPFAFY